MGSLELRYTPEDMSDVEISSLSEYMKNGCPGLTRSTEADVFKWFGLYMASKTYEEIAKITSSRKDLILYMSYKLSWCEKRVSHYGDLIQNMSQKVAQSKLDSVNTVLTMKAALNKFYVNKFNKFLSTNDSSLIENLDTKLLAQYNKSHDVLDKLMGRPPEDGQQSPLVNINVKSGKIEQIDENTVEITETDVSNILKALVDVKKLKDS